MMTRAKIMYHLVVIRLPLLSSFEIADIWEGNSMFKRSQVQDDKRCVSKNCAQSSLWLHQHCSVDDDPADGF